MRLKTIHYLNNLYFPLFNQKMLALIDKTDDEKIYDLLIWKRRSSMMINQNEENVEIIKIPFYTQNGKEPEYIVAKLFRSKIPLPNNPIVIFGHGNGENLDDYIEYHSTFCQHGISFCTFDYRGYGYSDGSYGTCSANERDDLIFVIKYLKNNGFEKVSYFGRSTGATCGIFAASEFPDIVCLALDSPWLSTKEWVEYRANDLYQISKEKFDELIPTVFNEVKEKTGINFNDLKEPREAAKYIKQPIFIIHGKIDSIVPFSNSEELFEIVKSEVKTFKSFNGDHNDFIRYNYYNDMFKFILRHNGVKI